MQTWLLQMLPPPPSQFPENTNLRLLFNVKSIARFLNVGKTNSIEFCSVGMNGQWEGVGH